MATLNLFSKFHSLMFVLLNGGKKKSPDLGLLFLFHSLMFVLLNGGSESPPTPRNARFHSLMFVLLNGGSNVARENVQRMGFTR